MKTLFTPALLIFLLFTLIPTVQAATTFTDIPSTHTAKNEITYLVEKQIIKGYPDGQFKGHLPITRLQASSMLVKALHLSTVDRPHPNLLDITEANDGYEIIATVVDEGILTGNTDRSFNPYQPMTRAQMATVLGRAFQLTGQSPYSFRDVPTTHWASSAVQTLLSNGLTTGYADNTFQPNQLINRTQFSVFLARALNTNFLQNQQCYVPTNEKKERVNVAVTTLWKDPALVRKADTLLNTKPVQITEWNTNLTRHQKLTTLGRIDSQALYGQEVRTLEKKGHWRKVAVLEQQDVKNPEGYIGWVPAHHLIEYYPNYATCATARVQSNTANLYHTPSTDKVFLTSSFNTELPLIQELGDWLQVQIPTGEMKFIQRKNVKIVSETQPVPTAEQLISTGKQFLKLPYIWSGTSGFGFDCSGFTHSIYKQHDILIPRDSTVQAITGQAVAKKDLQPGDLLFFSTEKGKGTVHHVSMYIGNGKMIHAPNYSRPIEIISMHTEPYQSEFSGARRYLIK